MRDDYLQAAQSVITDPNILINVVSRRAKQLKNGYKPLIESLERLSAEDIALPLKCYNNINGSVFSGFTCCVVLLAFIHCAILRVD